jgi:hypothetical protein
MKKKLYLFAILAVVGLSFSAYAQKNVKITWGPEFELPKKHYELGFIGDPKTGYVEVSHKHGESIALQKFSPTLQLKGETEVSTSNLPKNYMVESLGNIDNKNYIYYSTYSKSDNTEHLFAQELNVDKGQFQGGAKELVTSSEKLAGTLVMTGIYQFGTADKWNFVNSADSNRLLVYYRLKPKEKKDALNKDIIGLYVFDRSLNKVWGQQVEMPYTEKMMDNDDYQVDKEGNVYILAKVYNTEEKKKNKDDYHYEVLMYNKGSKKPNISSFSFADKFIVDIALTEDRNGKMICSGYYSKTHKGTDGAFFLAFDEASKSMKNIKKGFYEFPSDIIRQFESKRTVKKSEKKEEKGQDEEVSHLVYRDFVMGDDGSMTLYGEQYSYTMIVTFEHNTPTTIYHHFFNDIYVMKIGADGEMTWIKKIPKSQTGVTRNSSSPAHLGLGYHLHTSGDDSYLFFVDNIKNLDIKPDQAPATHMAGAGGVLMSVKLTGNGDVSKSSIFDFREEKMNVHVDKFSDVTDKIVIGRAAKLKGPFQFNFTEGKPLMITTE